jgi:HEAT repeat protein
MTVAPHLISALRDADPRVRFHAIELLQKFAPDLGAMIPAASVAIGNCLRDASELVQTRAVRASGALAQLTQRADIRLVNALYDADVNVRLSAAQALAKPHNDPTTMDALHFRLADERADVRVAACRALAGCGVNADVILPTLIHALSDSDLNVQLDVLDVLEALGVEALSALDALRDKTADSDPGVRAGAARLVSALEAVSASGATSGSF